MLNDFRKIRFAGRPFNSTDFTQLHRISKRRLEQELAQPFPGKTIVVTLCFPMEACDESPNGLKKLAHRNDFDLQPLFYEYEIDAWFHGHAHSSSDYRIAGTRNIMLSPVDCIIFWCRLSGNRMSCAHGRETRRRSRIHRTKAVSQSHCNRLTF